jgi:ribosome-associated heat shock protein Hsp15
VKTRSQAQALLGSSSARVDGRPITTVHAEVRPGSVVAMAFGQRFRAFRIETLPARRGTPADARATYTELAVDEGQARLYRMNDQF